MSALTFIGIHHDMASFTRIIMFAILRQALSAVTSSQILVGLALFLALFIMAPVFQGISSALQPYLGRLAPQQA